MKISEILEMSYTIKMDDIAKEHLPVGEKRARDILKSIDCAPNGVGKKGWSYQGEDPAVLDREFESFITNKTTKPTAVKTKIKASNSKSNYANSRTRLNNSKSDKIDNSTKQSTKDNTKTSKKEDTMRAEIQALIKGSSKEEPARIYKGVYFDKDIAQFLDNVQHGNKSEIINKILRQYLTDNELL